MTWPDAFVIVGVVAVVTYGYVTLAWIDARLEVSLKDAAAPYVMGTSPFSPSPLNGQTWFYSTAGPTAEGVANPQTGGDHDGVGSGTCEACEAESDGEIVGLRHHEGHQV